MTMVIVWHWITAGNPVSALKKSPIRCPASGFGPVCCPRTRSWRQNRCIRPIKRNALSAATRSYLNPTGPNTVLTVPQRSSVAKRPKVSGGAGPPAWNVKRAKPLANQSFRPRCQSGADTFIAYAVKQRSNIPQITNT